MLRSLATASKTGHDREVQEQTFLAVERPLQIRLNDESFVVTMRTPGADKALAIGLLLSEGIVSSEALPGLQNTASSFSKGDYDVIDLRIPQIYLCPNLDKHRALIANASCGICGQRVWQSIELAPLVRTEVAAKHLDGAFQILADNQPLFTETGAVHAAAAFNEDHELLSVHEDVGRHNAVDKVIGDLATNKQSAAVLVVSGRVSYEIVIKAWRANIGTLAAVSAPTSLAVETAAKANITLFGFCRDGRATNYTPQQLKTEMHP